MNFIGLLRDNKEIYFPFLILNILFVYFIAILIIFAIIEFKNKKLNNKWSIQILKVGMPTISNTFFGHIFLLLIKIFDCINGYAFVNAGIKCRTGLFFYIFAPSGIIAIIFLVLISLLTNMFYYKLVFIKSNSDILKKKGCLPDIIFLFTKIGINLLFALDKNNEEDHWIIIFFFIIISGINIYFTIHYQNRINKILSILSKILSAILFSSSLSLFFGKILKFSKFNGLIVLIPVLSLLISLYMIFYEEKYTNYFLIDHNKINIPDEYLNYIYSFYFTFINKNNDRNSKIRFKLAINTIEEKCVDKDCPLKKYILDLNDLDNEYLLFKYCDKLFSHGLSKFYNNFNFIVNYISFLIVELNNNKKALLLLNIIEENYSFSFNYSIHACRKLIYSSNTFKHENFFLDNYKNDIQIFKELIKKTIFLYYQFMLLLLECKIKKISNLNSTNKIGKEIFILKKEIDMNYQKNKNIKANNKQIITLYSEFNKIILNSKEIYKIIDYDDNLHNNEIDFSNFNSHFSKEKENDYLIISSDNNNIGEIIDCSINFCKMLGFHKDEIKGKNINILIPPIFHETHNLIIKELKKKYSLDFFENLIKRKIYKPDNIEKEIYCLTKSKFLKPIKIKIYFTRTAENKFIYFLKINQYIPLTNNLSLNEEMLNAHKYCILTDQNFFIKSFTPNCLESLNLNNKYINSKYCIINYIKELQEDYLMAFNKINPRKSSFNDTTDIIDGTLTGKGKEKKSLIINQTIKEKIHKNLIDLKYNQKYKITWQITEDNNFLDFKNKIKRKSSLLSRRRSSQVSTLLNINVYKFINEKEKKLNFFMEIKKIIINNQLLGYYFFFTKIANNKNNNLLKLNMTSYMSEINDKRNIKMINKMNLNNERKLISNDSFNSSEKSQLSETEEKICKNNSNLKDSETPKHSLFFKNEYKNEYDYFNINKNFIPKSSFNFIFNINNFSFEPSRHIKYFKKLKEILKKQAISKIQKYNEKINMNKNSSYYSNESDSETSDSNIDSESESSSSKSNSFSQKPIINLNLELKNMGFVKSSTLLFKENIKRNRFSLITDKAQTINKSKSRNSVTYNNRLVKNNNKVLEKHLSYNYYKVNLKNIRFLIYDFNKELFIENKNENMPKIEKIMKNNNIFRIGKDKMYPSIEFNNNINNSKDNNKDNLEKNNTIIKNNEYSLENKIKEEIIQKDDEISIKNLKKISFISILIFIILCALTLFLNLSYYSSIKKFIEVIKSIIRLTYCKVISIYYIKELTLLNFNAPNIYGGDYILFPSNNITFYKQLMANKLTELFVENNDALKNIFSSSISFSKNTIKYQSELVFKIDFMYNYREKSIYSDLYEALIQYNNVFYSMISSSVNLHQTNIEIYNFNHNGNLDFDKAINTLSNIYETELDNLFMEIKIMSIILLVFYLIILIAIYFFSLYFFFSANKRRINFMKIIYGINENFIKQTIVKCQNLINKLNNFNNNIQNKKEDESINELENKLDEINIKNDFNENENSSVNNEKESIIKKHLKFLVVYSLFFLIIYAYFFYIFTYIIKLSNKAKSMKEFFYRLQDFQINIIDIFNTYRQYTFDEKTGGKFNAPILDNLNYALVHSYETVTADVEYIQNYISKNIPMEGEMLEIFSRNLCSYYITDYFHSSEECFKKYGKIINQDFLIFASYFIDDIRILKNLVTYLLSTGKYRGKLNEYIVINWLNDDLIPKKSNVMPNQTTEYMFRLNLFNNETIHNHINTIFVNIILPYLDINRKTILKHLSIKGDDFYFILYSILYILVLLIFFFFFWLPIISKLNKNIRETKNILSIIPFDILLNENDINLFSKYNN